MQEMRDRKMELIFVFIVTETGRNLGVENDDHDNKW
jgi:hypothetical protein